MGSSYQSDGMRCTRDVFEGICNRMILHFYITANMGFWFLVMTGQALLRVQKDETRPGMVSSNYGKVPFIICNTITCIIQLWQRGKAF